VERQRFLTDFCSFLGFRELKDIEKHGCRALSYIFHKLGKETCAGFALLSRYVQSSRMIRVSDAEFVERVGLLQYE
jgi:hypothetical protein